MRREKTKEGGGVYTEKMMGGRGDREREKKERGERQESATIFNSISLKTLVDGLWPSWFNVVPSFIVRRPAKKAQVAGGSGKAHQ